jgi:Holliday junction DNA helicase RuvA
MIGRVSGRIVHQAADRVIVDVGGVGYVVQVSARTLAALPGAGDAATLWTEMVVREDQMALIGYPSLAEVEWHRLLTSVQGVGAKAALAILGALGADGLGRAVALADWAAVKAAPGVGPKLAQRVVNELAGRTPGGAAAALAAGPAGSAAPTGSAAEAVSALVNLGYAAPEAQQAVAGAGDAGAADTAALIRDALRRLAPA